MSDDKKSWVKVASFSALKDDHLVAVKMNETPLVLCRSGDDIRAFAGKCPHKGAPMEDGSVCSLSNAAQVIVCPWHKAVFSAETGRRIEPPALDALARYEAERRGDDVFVSPSPKPLRQPTIMRQHESVVIAGAGAAAIAACVTLRESGFGGSVTLISPEDNAPYDRTSLSKVALAKPLDRLKIPALRDAKWYESQQIKIVRDRITRFDFERRCFYLAGSETISGDHVLLATGSAAKRVDVAGADLQNVVTLRSAADARKIAASVDTESHVVVVGSGFIGMEAAAALCKRGVDVTVVSRSEYPFEKQFGTEIAARMRQLHEENGITFLGKSAVAKIGGEGQVAWVELDDGARLDANLVLTGVGAAPIIDYLTDFPRNQENGGLDVDDRMGLGNDVFAAGDIASVPVSDKRYRIEHWRSAQSQGQIAARAMLGLPVAPLSTPWFWTQQFDSKLEWVGWPGEAFDTVKIDGDLQSMDFIARLEKDQKLVGIIGSKRAKEMGLLAVSFDEA